MKNSKAKEIIVPAVSLFLICVVVTALLALTNAVTAPKIDALAVETQEATKKQVLSSADSFSEEKQVEKDGVSYTYYDGLASDGSVMGYVFVTSAKGYGGDISVMVGVLGDGTVAGVNILSINETAGLGMNAKNQSFLDQFLGKSGEIGVAKNNPSDTEIQALTGATITSSAMATAVNTALSLYAEIGGGQEDEVLPHKREAHGQPRALRADGRFCDLHHHFVARLYVERAVCGRDVCLGGDIPRIEIAVLLLPEGDECRLHTVEDGYQRRFLLGGSLCRFGPVDVAHRGQPCGP